MEENCNDKVWESRVVGDEKRPNDTRSEWGRDLARLIHSSAFRRMQAKTQVLGLGESDFYRTRLTHSMEVAQIGTGILEVLKSKNKYDEILPSSTLMQAICLSHDIGHPPFGHGGEVALNKCMLDYGGFEGNGQTLRILSKLEKYTEAHGINPTRRMMLGVLKYPVKYSNLVSCNESQEHSPSWLFKDKIYKPPKCYLDTEEEVVDFILQPFSPADRSILRKVEDNKPLYKSLDTSIMDLADEISYSLHDLEDAISLGMITKKIWNEYFSKKEDIIIACHNKHFNENFKELAEQLFSSSHKRKKCIGKLVNLFITNVEVVVQNSEFSHLLLKNKVQLPNNLEALRSVIFQLVLEKVIKHENVQQLEFKGQKLVVEIFEVLATDPERFLPESPKNRYKEISENDSVAKFRVISDFISGMTDDYATKFYEKLFSPRRGSIFDRF
ncbi:anti-phage deoxyguanosine triphosphatase [Psychrobacter sp. Pi2-51]|uniref:anti-phage deoxyguanosine triphosphatase n=1 Tax=Psychrobacter sp. Pi2-51 TaxID=2774132 RepID=UPI001918415B|nr:anti-phage deoxyguanosine triphosphatase [Psychrobacter sp. Pi2-51]